MTTQDIQTLCWIYFVVCMVAMAIFGIKRGTLLRTLLSLTLLIALIGATNFFDATQRVVRMTGGKPFHVVTAEEKAAQQAAAEVQRQKQLRDERNTLATIVIRETTYLKDLRTNPPTCYAYRTGQIVGVVDCKTIPLELLGIADVR
jgi:hypothetical protein